MIFGESGGADSPKDPAAFGRELYSQVPPVVGIQIGGCILAGLPKEKGLCVQSSPAYTEAPAGELYRESMWQRDKQAVLALRRFVEGGSPDWTQKDSTLCSLCLCGELSILFRW